MTVHEAYARAGVVHSEVNCPVCTLDERISRRRKYAIVKVVIDFIIITLLIVIFLMSIMHPDWIVGGLPK
jgi:hypothetical protein